VGFEVNVAAATGLKISLICVALGVLVPVFASTQTQSPTSKLQQYFLAFGPLFVLLSISTEGLFYASFSLTLYLWVEVEARLYRFVEKPAQRRAAVRPAKRNRGWRAEALSRSLGEETAEKVVKEEEAPVAGQSRRLVGADVRRAVFFLFFVQVAFFGAAKYVLVCNIVLFCLLTEF
jgi:phosphatidylinositol glycan class N